MLRSSLSFISLVVVAIVGLVHADLGPGLDNGLWDDLDARVLTPAMEKDLAEALTFVSWATQHWDNPNHAKADLDAAKLAAAKFNKQDSREQIAIEVYNGQDVIAHTTIFPSGRDERKYVSFPPIVGVCERHSPTLDGYAQVVADEQALLLQHLHNNTPGSVEHGRKIERLKQGFKNKVFQANVQAELTIEGNVGQRTVVLKTRMNGEKTFKSRPNLPPCNLPHPDPLLRFD